MLQNFNYAKLRERIGVKYVTPEEFARAAGLSPVELTAKLNNAADFSFPEIDKACCSLGIKNKEITEFFFNGN